ncbi:hypothetical protein [Komagataeibacter rhaeticus]|uniref:hypothetical protein n=1 Tax=Komagataeibacter rhaeticus TaxID=215221 RepID=UPI0038D1AC1E
MKHWSLATRIVSSVLSVVTVSLLALSMAVAGFTRYEITERLDNSLQEVSERLQATTVTHLQGPRPDNVAWVPDVGPRTLAYQVVDRSGHVVLRSQNAPVQPFVADMRTGFANTPTSGYMSRRPPPRPIVCWWGNPTCTAVVPHGVPRPWRLCRYWFSCLSYGCWCA